MASKALTPRQKMINMMYLVLTALLAMNVSKEVLNAFTIVDKGIENSNASLQKKNEDYYKAFETIKNQKSNELALQMYALSFETKAITLAAINHINNLQNELKQESGMVLQDGKETFKNLDDQQTATRILTQEQNGKIKGEDLRILLDSLRTSYLAIIEKGNTTLKGSPAYKDYGAMYASILPLEIQKEEVVGLGNEKKTWADFNFGNVPIVASDVILEKLKNDIIQTEAQILEYLMQQINMSVIDFNTLEAKVIAPKSYLASGKTYESEIFISASSSESKIEVFVGKIDKSQFQEKEKKFVEGNDLPFIGAYETLDIQNGKAVFKQVASGKGQKNYEGIIRLALPTGGYELYPFYSDYEVAPPSGFSVSATQMNVLYIGVDNPIDIAVNGAKSDEDIQAKISQGTLVKQSNGKYIARVTTQGKATIQVNAMVNEVNEKFTPMEFRVLEIPDPKISLCGFALKNKMTKSELLACSGLIAQNADFIFQTKFQVLSFEVIVSNKVDNKRTNNSGPLFNSDVLNYIQNLQKKDVIIFDQIMVKDPANKTRKINGSIAIEII